MGLVSSGKGLMRALVAVASLLLAATPAAAETGAVPGKVNPYGLATYPDAARTCPHLPRSQFARCVAQSDIPEHRQCQGTDQRQAGAGSGGR